MTPCMETKNSKLLLAIDPGNVYSAYVLIDPVNYRPVRFAKLANPELMRQIERWRQLAKKGHPALGSAVIETMIGSYGQIGRTTIDTAITIGRLE